jgi:hypothetical protein
MRNATMATVTMAVMSNGMIGATVAITMDEMTADIIMAGTVTSAAASNGVTIIASAFVAEY